MNYLLVRRYILFRGSIIKKQIDDQIDQVCFEALSNEQIAGDLLIL